MSSDAKQAKTTFIGGLNCSQAIINQYAPHYNLDPTIACRLATGFGGGMGRMGGTCGALTGAYLVLGLEYGSASSAEKIKKDQTYEKIQELSKKFEQKNGSCQCRDLLACDISTTEGFLYAKEQGLSQSRCPNFVNDAVEILEEIISQNQIDKD